MEININLMLKKHIESMKTYGNNLKSLSDLYLKLSDYIISEECLKNLGKDIIPDELLTLLLDIEKYENSIKNYKSELNVYKIISEI